MPGIAGGVQPDFQSGGSLRQPVGDVDPAVDGALGVGRHRSITVSPIEAVRSPLKLVGSGVEGSDEVHPHVVHRLREHALVDGDRRLRPQRFGNVDFCLSLVRVTASPAGLSSVVSGPATALSLSANRSEGSVSKRSGSSVRHPT